MGHKTQGPKERCKTKRTFLSKQHCRLSQCTYVALTLCTSAYHPILKMLIIIDIIIIVFMIAITSKVTPMIILEDDFMRIKVLVFTLCFDCPWKLKIDLDHNIEH